MTKARRSAMRAGQAAVALALTVLATRSEAARVRIVTSSSVELEPALSADQRVLIVRARVRDDRGNPIAGAVTLRVAGAPVSVLRASANARGEARFEVPLGERHALDLQAELEGTSAVAPARTQARVDLDEPFVTLRLDAPRSVELTGPAFDATVTVAMSVTLESVEGVEVQLSVDGEPEGLARADATGLARFRVDASRLGAPGMHELLAVYARRGLMVRSPVTRVVARARTALRIASVHEREAGLEVLGALASGVGPVRDAPVRLYAGDRAMLATLTDVRGGFSFRLSSEALAAAHIDEGVGLQVRFEPAEPWLAPSRVDVPRPARAAQVPVRWPWSFGVLVLASSLFAIARAIGRARRSAVAVETTANPLGEVVRYEPPPPGDRTVRLGLLVRDRATGLAITSARARWIAPQRDEDDARVPVAVRGGLACEVVVRAQGYPEAQVRIEAPLAAGLHVRDVELISYREALFDRGRSWLARSRSAFARSSPLPTPREALSERAHTVSEQERALAQQVERGAYGPDEPTDATLRHVETIAGEVAARSAAREGAPSTARGGSARGER